MAVLSLGLLHAGSPAEVGAHEPWVRLQLSPVETVGRTGVVLSRETLAFAVDLAATPLRIEVGIGKETLEPRAVRADPNTGLLLVQIPAPAEATPPADEAVPASWDFQTDLRSELTGAVAVVRSVRCLPGFLELLEMEAGDLAAGQLLRDQQGQIRALPLFAGEPGSWVGIPWLDVARLKLPSNSRWDWPGLATAEEWGEFQTSLHDLFSGRPELALEGFRRVSAGKLGGIEVEFWLAAALAELGRQEESIQKAAEVLMSDSSHAGALALAGALFFSIERYPRAEDLCRRSLSRKPQPPVCHGIIGSARHQAGDEPSALEQFEALTRSSVSPARVAFGWLGVGNALAGSDRHREALDALGRAQQVLSAPVADRGWASSLFGDRVGLDSGLNLSEARSLMKLGRWNEAVERFERTLNVEPALATAAIRVEYAESLSRLGRWGEAAQVLEDTTRRFPESAEAYHWLGVAFSWLKRWPEASAALANADRLRPGDHETLYLWGVSLLRQNRREEAWEVHARLQPIDTQLAALLAQQLAR